MPDVTLDGQRIHYVEAGGGPETVVLSHSYLVDHRHFEPQIAALAEHFRVLAYDHRDHGASGHAPGSYGLEEIVRDGLGFVEAVAEGPVHWVGLSTGGFVGLRLALRRPDLVRSLVVMGAAADAEPWKSRLKYSAMLFVLRWLGFGPLIGETMKVMFGPAFLADPERRDERELWKARMIANDRRALVRFGHAIFRRDDVGDRLAGIRAPTLVLRGEDDRAIGRRRARRTAEGIPGARFVELPGAGHLSTVETPGLATEHLLRFLREPGVEGAGPG